MIMVSLFSVCGFVHALPSPRARYGGLFFAEDRAWCDRNFLHAQRIRVKARPEDGDEIEPLEVRV